MKQRRWPEWAKNLVIQERAKGNSYQALAVMLGIPEGRVRKFYRRWKARQSASTW